MKPDKLLPGLLVVTSVKYSNGELCARIERYHYSDGDVEVKAWEVLRTLQRRPLTCKYPEDLTWLRTDNYYVDGDIEVRIQFGEFKKLYPPAHGRRGNLLLQKRRQRRRDQRRSGDLHDPFICEGCGEAIDPEVCWCGINILDHPSNDPCPRIPMGCNCCRDML